MCVCKFNVSVIVTQCYVTIIKCFLKHIIKHPIDRDEKSYDKIYLFSKIYIYHGANAGYLMATLMTKMYKCATLLGRLTIR